MADLAVALGEKLVLVLLQHTRGHLVAFLQVVQLDHQHILVVAAVENGDGPAGGQRLVDPPQEVVFQLFTVGLFKTGHLHALGVQAGHHMFDGAVLAGGVHGLQNEDQSFAAVGIKGVLQSGHFLQVFGGLCQNFLFVDPVGLAVGSQFVQSALAAAVKTIGIRFHSGALPAKYTYL